MARIRVALRHRQQGMPTHTVYSVGDITIDVERHSVVCRGAKVKLTPKEFDLLLLLARHPGRVLTYRYILNAVWGPAHVEEAQYLRVLIGQLHHKLELKPEEPELIATEPGIGYRLNHPAS